MDLDTMMVMRVCLFPETLLGYWVVIMSLLMHLILWDVFMC